MHICPARNIYPRTRVTILEPRSSDPGVLLDHRGRNPGSPQLDRRTKASHAGADHHHLEPFTTLRIWWLAPFKPSREWVERELLEPKLELLLRKFVPCGQAQTGAQPLLRPDADLRCRSIPNRPEELCRLC